MEGEGAVGGSESLLHLLGPASPREDEPEVPVAFGEGDDPRADGKGDLDVGDAADGAGVLDAGHAAEHAGSGNRDHHDPRGSRSEVETGLSHPEGVAEDEDLERGSQQTELEAASAHAPDGAGGDLDDRGTSVRDAELGMDGTLGETETAGGTLGQGVGVGEDLGAVPGGSDEDRLLEEGAVEGIGLVEGGEDLELAGPEHGLHRDLVAGDEALGEHGGVGIAEDAPNADGGGAGGVGIVGPDDAPARRQAERLEDGGEPERGGDLPGVIGGSDGGEGRLSHLTGVEEAAHDELVPGGPGGVGRASRQPEALGGESGDDDAAVVGGDDSVDGRRDCQVDEALGRTLRIGAVDADEAIAHGERWLLLGGDGQFDAEGSGGGDEVLGVIARGGEDDEGAHHAVQTIRPGILGGFPLIRTAGTMTAPAVGMTMPDTDAIHTGVTGGGVPADPVLAVDPTAVSTILALRDEEPGEGEYGLLIEVTGIRGTEFSYELSFLPLADIGSGRRVERHGELPVVVRDTDVPKLRGASLEISDDGLVMRNPNDPRPPSMSTPEGNLTGPLADQVMYVLAEQVNPAIASHGGGAQLVSVDGSVAYLRLSGGCQGCGMAQVTLHQGIERILLDTIPELSAVVDVTDHASGSNPYYESAKK